MIYAAVYNIKKDGKALKKYHPDLLLSGVDLQEYESMVHVQDKQRKLASRILMYDLLNHLWPGKFNRHSFSKTAYSKPILKGLKGISISHSGNFSAVAVSVDDEIGLDIQRHESIAVDDMESVLSTGEKASFTRLQAEKQTTWFYDLWSKKEAILKAEGVGLGIEPTDVTVPPEDNGVKSTKKTWYFSPCPHIDSYSLQLCVPELDPQVSWYQWHDGSVVPWEKKRA